VEVSQENTNEWWDKLVEIEKSIGIDRGNINDDMGGSYRTPHDHVLLYVMPSEIMQKLQEIRFIDNHTEKMEVIDKYMKAVRGTLHND
jgi:hypothetical protein